MGLFGSFAALLGMDANKKEAIRGEIDLPMAVQAHIHWKLRLQDYMEGRSTEQLDPMVICRDDQCELGKWIHGSGMDHFHSVDAFHDLRADHAEFHYVAAKVVKGVQANDHAGAEALLKGDYAHVSHKVIIALTELNRVVEE